MTENMIKALESKGFHRWTKGDYDRLYANAEDFGLYTESYNYIDVKTDKLITSRITADADEIVEAVKAAMYMRL